MKVLNQTKRISAAVTIISSLLVGQISQANFKEEHTYIQYTQVISSIYKVTCPYEGPLMTSQNCDNKSYAGYKAKECAFAQALQQCEEDYNTDCVEKTTTYKEYISLEFVGYKACQATVTIRGYRMK